MDNQKPVVRDMKIECRFKPSLANIFKKEIEEIGFDTSKLITDEDVLHSYCSYSHRLLEKRPRIIHKADMFVCPDEVKEGLAWLESKIEKGESINPHLNTAIQKDKLDGLLYDWGIHHLHLGLKYESTGFVERTGPVLFAVFRTNDVYFVDIRDHEGWSDKGLLEIINRNWPELLSIYRMKGVKPETAFTEEEITSLRKAGVNTFHELSDGNSYLSMGGGITTAGTSQEAVRTYIEIMRLLGDIENQIRVNSKYLVSHVKPKGHPFRDRTCFMFVCRRVGDEIRFYDVVNNNYWQTSWHFLTLKKRFGL